MPKWSKIFLGVVVVVAAFIAFVFWITSAITDVASQQLDALRKGDIEKAYSYTSKDFKSATSLEEFRSFIDSYPSLKSNKSSFFSNRTIENDVGTLKGSLESQDGAVTPVEYKLVKENNEWKILSITVLPTGAGIQQQQTQEPEDLSLTKSYSDPKGLYTIKYPTSWESSEKSETTVLFSGREGRDSYYTTVNIQALPTKVNGGVYENADALLEDLRNQLKDDTGKNISASEPFEYKVGDKTVTGFRFNAEYEIEGDKFKQMQMVVPSLSGDKFVYALAYTSPPEIYDTYKVVADAILSTWEQK